MDELIVLLGNWVGDEGTLRIVILFIAGTVVTIFGLGVGYLLLGIFDPARQRLQKITLATASGLDVQPSQASRASVDIEAMMGPMGKYLLPNEDAERNSVTRKLIHAGYRSPNALQMFYSIKAVFAIGLPLLIYATSFFIPSLSSNQIMLYALCGCGAGLLVPNMVLERLVLRRLKLLRAGFPDALDLMVVCVEAGLGLSQAIQRVADELAISHEELAEEFMTVTVEVGAGVERVKALKNLATRSGLDDIKGLVSLLVQTLRFGTSVADSLRIYSEEFRDRRMQAAEEMAAKMGTKLIFPLIFFMFPAFFVIAIGPAVMKLGAVFQQVGSP